MIHSDRAVISDPDRDLDTSANVSRERRSIIWRNVVMINCRVSPNQFRTSDDVEE